jgi:hypothetical protein
MPTMFTRNIMKKKMEDVLQKNVDIGHKNNLK